MYGGGSEQNLSFTLFSKVMYQDRVFWCVLLCLLVPVQAFLHVFILHRNVTHFIWPNYTIINVTTQKNLIIYVYIYKYIIMALGPNVLVTTENIPCLVFFCDDILKMGIWCNRMFLVKSLPCENLCVQNAWVPGDPYWHLTLLMFLSP